ncbi:OLC1v1017365C1 [Oldenlandia corymbosa var. corymbosa]|uniref:OLC1v1017365C1 n=1 Tax=Oldenlandia corymbosa var. corymbosa TaxID=529605 RepID=A0AAV1E9A3_OLDCO|nr:OLC1v1017365C1 [Oldenlandia corymbosa var. corymbosa]
MFPNTRFWFTICSFLVTILAVLPSSQSAFTRKLALVQPPATVLKYHKGQLLFGNVTVNLIWYGKFTPTQRAIVVDFIRSLSQKTYGRQPEPTVASWWSTTQKYSGRPVIISLGKQISLNYTLGKSLNDAKLEALASKYSHVNTINFILTASDVSVYDFCMNRCGTHGWTRGKTGKFPYAWVGNSLPQCPDQCAWPFHRPIVGPQTPPLVAPNRDVGIDGMIINIATVLAGTVTNPFDQGYYQGPSTAPLEAVTACTGIFGSGAFPGYPGTVLKDKKTGASYNARGVRSREYLLPAMWDPKTSTCKPLV